MTFPPHLAERIHVVSEGSPRRGPVIYWMHHALRAAENPALDVARRWAHETGESLLVYQGLSGNHRHNNDRHATFILESARDVALALAEEGIRYAFHLPTDALVASPLTDLVSTASLLVVEDHPMQPFPGWVEQMASRCPGKVLAVDTRCIVPMRLAGRAFDRAFAFRGRLQKEFEARVSRPWPIETALPQPFGAELGFDPVDWATPIHRLVGSMDLDHSVAPIPDSPGGVRAGYARWDEFRQRGLGGYARQRNDAAVGPPSGVSRLSPYLHYGCVSPFRIAREARQQGGAGAEKYLDELFVWRELAHNHCLHSNTGAVLDALPQWARETLEAHRHDPRPTISEEDLERGKTGDALWDLAQRSLLRNGELHNNVRMTWGKMLVEWGESPERALELLFDLNDRFALDGSDPNSVGGLLWCMGLFDRPFPPERAVTGVLRTRSSSEHARRLDLDAYRNRIVGAFKRPHVAVIGGGLSGLAAARTLQDNGCAVTVFDKGKRPGGRMASWEGPFAFDYGAQYFTARDARFARVVDHWRRRGLVRAWEGELGVYNGSGVRALRNRETRLVGVPSMNAVAAHLAADLNINTSAPVTRLGRDAETWTVRVGDDVHDGFDAVLVTIPEPQARRLLEDSETEAVLPAAQMQPCWTVVVQLADQVDTPWDGVFVNEGPIGWMARDSSKPDRGEAPVWVIQAAPHWSEDHLEELQDDVARELIRAAERVIGSTWPEPVHQKVHRWRYARGGVQAPGCSLWDESQAIGFGGDWLAGGRIEGAWLSGVSAAGAVLRDPQFHAEISRQAALF